MGRAGVLACGVSGKAAHAQVGRVANATPVTRYDYGLGVPESGFYHEIISTDAETYGGRDVGNFGGVQAQGVPWMGRQHSILIHLPPLATLAFKLDG